MIVTDNKPLEELANQKEPADIFWNTDNAHSVGIGQETQSQDNQYDRPYLVYIIDDHPLVRDGIASAISKNPDLQMIGEAETALEAMADLQRVRPDIILVDLSLRESCGYDVIEFARITHPQIRILVISHQQDLSCIKRAVELGANGYLVKSEPLNSVVEAILETLHGKSYFSPELAPGTLDLLLQQGKSKQNLPQDILSKRELEIFQMIGEGKNSDFIAQTLHVSNRTLETHCHNIRRKLALDSLIEFHHKAFHWVLSQGSHIAMVLLLYILQGWC